MATLNPQDNSGLLDQNIPQWKRELILKRRALGRTLQAGNVYVKLTRPPGAVGRNDDSVGTGVRIGNVSGKQQRCASSVLAVVQNQSSLDQNEADFHPGHSSTCSTGSVLNMRYADTDRLVDDAANGVSLVNSGGGCVLSTEKDNKVMLDNNCAFKCVIGTNNKMGEEKSIIIKRPNNGGSLKSGSDNNKRDSVKRKQVRSNPVTSVLASSGNKIPAEDDGDLSDSSEELKYGPGIVNKLKTKYLSMTLRENQKRGVRPSLSNLRRATSLENMLEDDLKTQQKNIIVSSAKSINPSCNYPSKFNDKNNISKSQNKCAAVSINYSARRIYGGVNGESIMKRACSMDTLLHSGIQTNKSVLIGRLNKTILDKDASSLGGKKGTIAPSIANEDLIIVESSNKFESNDEKISQQPFTRSGIKGSSSVEEKELPPPDVVKQTLKKFESVPKSKTAVNVEKKMKIVNLQSVKPYRSGASSISSSNGMLSSSFTPSSTACKDKPIVNKSSKPILSPKPVLSPEKYSSSSPTNKITTSPKRNIKGRIEKPNVISARPSSRLKNYSKFGAENCISESKVKEVISSAVDNSVISDKKETHLISSLADSNNVQNVSPVIVPSNDSVVQCISSAATTTGQPVFNKIDSSEPNLLKCAEVNESLSNLSVPSSNDPCLQKNSLEGNDVDSGDENSSDDFNEGDTVSEIRKSVSSDALENIRKGGTSVKFNFKNDESSASGNNIILNKSYLPATRESTALQATNTTLLLATQSAPVVIGLNTPLKHQDTSPVLTTTQMKQVGVIRPILNPSKIQQNIAAVKPLTCSSLTDLEIEKNLINNAKSIEQPVSKVVVAIKTLPDSVVLGPVQTDLSSNKNFTVGLSATRMSNTEVKSRDLWSDKKPWHQNQNTMIFNFSDRKDVPDYIENDGLILRGKRERPKPGDGGFIFLGGGGGRHESSTDYMEDEEATDDWSTLADDPPSPCDVCFVNDNVLINGKSNLRKHPKQKKLRIQFKDEPTTFEYPSESSLAEQMSGGSSVGVDEPDTSTSSHSSIQRPKSPPPRVPVASATASASQSSSTSIPSAPCLGSSSLASYTPSKLGKSQRWQPGVTRHAASVHSAATSGGNKSSATNDSAVATNADYLKPATPEQTVAWSEETTSDMLF